MDLHLRIQALRESLELSKVEVARRTSISRQAYDAIESGESRPNVDTLIRLAAALGVQPGALLDEPDAPAEGAA
jgi:transcriptional regulator with XRE-family HTH domain